LLVGKPASLARRLRVTLDQSTVLIDKKPVGEEANYRFNRLSSQSSLHP
jgi:hypothetical protein